MRLSTKILAGSAAVVVLAVVAFGAVRYASAQTPAAGNGLRQQFLDRLAQNLNITTDELTSAVTTSELETVDDLLANDKITQAQADKLKTAINNGAGPGRLFAKGQQARAKALTALRRQIVVSSSEAIGVGAAELRGELQAGKSIADVAAEHNVSVDAVKSQITDGVQARLDTAVANGKITPTLEDQAMQRLADNLDTILNKKKAA